MLWPSVENTICQGSKPSSVAIYRHCPDEKLNPGQIPPQPVARAGGFFIQSCTQADNCIETDQSANTHTVVPPEI